MLIIVYKVQAEAALSQYSTVANRSECHGILDNDIYFRSLYHEGFKHSKGKPPYSIIPAY